LNYYWKGQDHDDPALFYYFCNQNSFDTQGPLSYTLLTNKGSSYQEERTALSVVLLLKEAL
jgi:hypothetical protein